MEGNREVARNKKGIEFEIKWSKSPWIKGAKNIPGIVFNLSGNIPYWYNSKFNEYSISLTTHMIIKKNSGGIKLNFNLRFSVLFIKFTFLQNYLSKIADSCV